MDNERRIYPRVEVSFPVECKVLPGSVYFYTVSKDISLVGIKIISDRFMIKDSTLKLQASLQDLLARFTAKIVWCSKQRVSDKYYAGLTFIETTNETQRYIKHFLHNITST
jgi:c-di-GMP-binding flagellar brake protein YcgR